MGSFLYDRAFYEMNPSALVGIVCRQSLIEILERLHEGGLGAQTEHLLQGEELHSKDSL